MQGKGENELKKLRDSITFKSGSCPETDSPGNHIMKVIHTISSQGFCRQPQIIYFHDMQEKGNGELKKMRNSITFRPGSYNETDSPGNQIKKLSASVFVNFVICNSFCAILVSSCLYASHFRYSVISCRHH